MTIGMIKPDFGSIGTIQPIDKSSGVERTKAPGGEESFKDMFASAIKEVDHLQKEANARIEDVIVGRDGVSTHDAMIALEKADNAFQLMNALRTKIIRAYEEVLRTQV